MSNIDDSYDLAEDCTFLEKFEVDILVLRILKEVKNGNYYEICLENITYGAALEEYTQKGLVDEHTAKMAFVRGKDKRAPLILKEVARGNGYQQSGHEITFGGELDELVDEGFVDEDAALIACLKGKRARGEYQTGSVFKSKIELPELDDPMTSTLHLSYDIVKK